MTITHKIQMDLIHRGIVPRLSAVQGDALTRQVEISLRAEGSPWPIPGEPTVLIRYRRPDRITGEYDTLPDGTPAGYTQGSAVTIVLSREVLAVPGDVMVVVTLIRGGRELSTFEFIITVQPNHSRDIFAGKDQASVTGMLPAPDVAKPGQILVIQEVDEYGLIRKMKADDALPGTTITQIALDESLSDETVSRYLITMNDGSVHAFDVNHGKSAYAYAQEAGYSGSEQEFARKLAHECSPIHVGEDAPEDAEVCLWIDTDEEAEAGVPSDWNASEGKAGYILNRTHWAEPANTLIFPEAEVVWNADTGYAGVMETSKALQIGTQYEVVYDGVKYVCAATSYMGMPCLGNQSIFDLDGSNLADTEEPFVIIYTEGMCVLTTENFRSESPTDGSAVVQITEITENVRKLDRKYLPALSYVITDVTDETVNESYDNFADILWNGGSVFIRRFVDQTYVMYAVTAASWSETTKWLLSTDNFGSVLSFHAKNGTWTPPAV